MSSSVKITSRNKIFGYPSHAKYVVFNSCTTGVRINESGERRPIYDELTGIDMSYFIGFHDERARTEYCCSLSSKPASDSKPIQHANR